MEQLQGLLISIRAIEPLLRDNNHLFYDRSGVARFTNNFYEELGKTSPNLELISSNNSINASSNFCNTDMIPIHASNRIVKYGSAEIDIPPQVAEIKKLYRKEGYSRNTKHIEAQIHELGKEIYRHMRASIFGKYAPHMITKENGSKMKVSSYANEAGEKFGHIISNPTVSYVIMWLAIARDYSEKNTNMTTCTLTRYINDGRYISSYDEIMDMSEDEKNELFPDTKGTGVIDSGFNID